jgi:hypothetical protein
MRSLRFAVLSGDSARLAKTAYACGFGLLCLPMFAVASRQLSPAQAQARINTEN